MYDGLRYQHRNTIGADEFYLIDLVAHFRIYVSSKHYPAAVLQRITIHRITEAAFDVTERVGLFEVNDVDGLLAPCAHVEQLEIGAELQNGPASAIVVGQHYFLVVVLVGC